jgi:hypothetical protein
VILQSSGQTGEFLCHHLGYPFPWPALLDKIGQRFRAAIDATLTAPYAAANQEQSGCRYEPAGF